MKIFFIFFYTFLSYFKSKIRETTMTKTSRGMSLTGWLVGNFMK
ncbi:MAG: hypothetical protein QW757_02855 [Candidatus Woesearchaeota archaeon]